MAVVDTAENGKYFSPHDARIGGVLCEDCKEPLKFEESNTKDGHTMTAEHCNKTYVLNEEDNYHLVITNKEAT